MPSSPVLARRMAAMTIWDERTWILELGAGTGVVTQALLARGAPAQRLLAIERSEALAVHLRRRFPQVRVVCGDAASLRRLVQKAAPRAHRFAVVSSLPFRSLPPPVGEAIRAEIAALLATGGQWTQFTYAVTRREVPAGFIRQSSSKVWINVPPARVDVFAAHPTVHPA
ncbi:MAG: methyltransferase domain-containing protein [Verrucomicrobiae bacterium]|nr:methyltransferase domain-containing protein [Verrucomicrobiae bacterium]